MSRLSDRGLSKVSIFVMLASLVICSLAGIAFIRGTESSLLDAMTRSVYEWYWLSIANIVGIELTSVSMVLLAIREHRGEIQETRYMTRVLVVSLIGTALLSVVVNGITWFLVAYVVQLVCVVAYQVDNDPNLGERVEWNGLGWWRRIRSAFAAPFVRHRLTELPEAEYRKIDDAEMEDAYRDRYIPLNAFNLLFIFLAGSFFGCMLEDAWHVLTEGFFQERAGLVFGPFTPIYGCGAVAMTVALNRFWRASWWRVTLVSGVVGCLVEYVTSWYLEAAVGVVAWDYAGTVGNIGGRVNIFFFFVWGLLGLLWVKLFLPVIMRLVDAIPVPSRAIVTSIVFAFLLADVVLTTVAMDGYSKRHAGIEPEGSAEMWVAENFDDEWMAWRFEKMEFGDQPVHVQIEEEASKFRLF